MSTPRYELRRVDVTDTPHTELTKPYDAILIAQKILAGKDREHLLVTYVDHMSRVLGTEIVAVGSAKAVGYFNPSSVFRGAILAGADSIIITHNHPGGTAIPSPQDRQMFAAYNDLGQRLELPVIDFQIVSDDPKDYFSLAEEVRHAHVR